jgi:hypothetical protein
MARWHHPYLGSGKMALNTGWLHYDGGIFFDRMVSLNSLSNGTERHLHATYRLKIEICYGSKRHLPLRDRCPSELGMIMKRPNCSRLRWDLKGFVASLDVTSLDSFEELVIDCKTFSL